MHTKTQDPEKSAHAEQVPSNRFKRLVHKIKTNKQKLFWYWIVYQCIKGALTTSLIWIPLLYLWLEGK